MGVSFFRRCIAYYEGDPNKIVTYDDLAGESMLVQLLPLANDPVMFSDFLLDLGHGHLDKE